MLCTTTNDSPDLHTQQVTASMPSLLYVRSKFMVNFILIILNRSSFCFSQYSIFFFLNSLHVKMTQSLQFNQKLCLCFLRVLSNISININTFKLRLLYKFYVFKCPIGCVWLIDGNFKKMHHLSYFYYICIVAKWFFLFKLLKMQNNGIKDYEYDNTGYEKNNQTNQKKTVIK